MTKITDIDIAENFGCAIVEQAINDYKNALECLQKGFVSYTDAQSKTVYFADSMKMDCERFFKSDWCYRLSPVEGTRIIKTIRENMNWDEEAYQNEKRWKRE